MSDPSHTGIYAFDDHFLWNKFLVSGLLDFREKLDHNTRIKFDRAGFLVSTVAHCVKRERERPMKQEKVFAIRGYVGVESVCIHNEMYDLSVVSKLSCKRAGTRFNSRGIDDNGHVANFVEVRMILYKSLTGPHIYSRKKKTETILCSERQCFAFTQVRGSVPGESVYQERNGGRDTYTDLCIVFWEQQGIVNQKIQISRSLDATLPAVRRHFTELLDRYQSICNINLLSKRESSSGGESVLANAFHDAVKHLDLQVQMVHFDVHAECRGGNYHNLAALIEQVRPFLDDSGYFLMATADNRIISTQQGVFRTNCMDCLDRTNLVQNKISWSALQEYIYNCFQTSDQNELLLAKHSHLWAENGDKLSKIYAGTGALKTAFTRTGKVTFMNVLSDATRSANRFFINNFQDKSKQEVIDELLVCAYI